MPQSVEKTIERIRRMRDSEINSLKEDLTKKSIDLKKLKPGQKIWFELDKRPYKVRACNERFIICTKPFNLKHTVIYTIIDIAEFVRGTENLIFCNGFETDLQCIEALNRLTSGQTEVSHRNRVLLDITRIQ